MDERRETGGRERPVRRTSGTRTQEARKTAGTGTQRRSRPDSMDTQRKSKADASDRPRRTRPVPEEEMRNNRTAGSRNISRPTQARNSGSGRKRKSKRRRRQSLILKVFLLFILIAGGLGGALLWTKYGPSKEEYNLKKYFGIESDGQYGVTVDNEVIGPQAIESDGHVYVSYETVRDYINSRFYWDANENILLYTLPTEMVSTGVGSKDYTVSKDTKSEDYVILKTEGSTAYIALDFVKQYTDMEYKVCLLYTSSDSRSISGYRGQSDA